MYVPPHRWFLENQGMGVRLLTPTMVAPPPGGSTPKTQVDDQELSKRIEVLVQAKMWECLGPVINTGKICVWLLVAIGAAAMITQVRAECAAMLNKGDTNPVLQTVKDPGWCRLPALPHIKFRIAGQVVLVVEMAREQVESQNLESAIEAFDEYFREQKIAQQLQDLLPAVQRFRPDGWVLFPDKGKALKHLGWTAPDECLARIASEGSARPLRGSEELAEAVRILHKDNGLMQQTLFVDSVKHSSPKISYYRPCAQLHKPALVGIGEDLNEFGSCALFEKGLRPQHLNHMRQKLGYFDCIEEAARMKSYFMYHYKTPTQNGSWPSECFILPTLDMTHARSWRAKEWPGNSATILGKINCRCAVPITHALGRDTGKGCGNYFLNLVLGQPKIAKTIGAITRLAVQVAQQTTFTCRAIYWDVSRTVVRTPDSPLHAECVAIQENPTSQLAPEEMTLRHLIAKMQDNQLKLPNADTIKRLIQEQIISPDIGQRLLGLEGRQKRGAFLGLFQSLARMVPHLMRRVPVRQVARGGPAFNRLRSTLARVPSLKQGLKVIKPYGQVAVGAVGTSVVGWHFYQMIDQLTKVGEPGQGDQIVHAIDGFVDLVETLYDDVRQASSGNDTIGWAVQPDQPGEPHVVGELEHLLEMDFPKRNQVQQALTSVASEMDVFKQSAEALESFGNAQMIFGADRKQIQGWRNAGYQVDPLAHLQADNYGIVATQSLRLAARKRMEEKNYYFFPLQLERYGEEALKAVLPEKLEWHNETRLQSLNPCVTATLLRENLDVSCQFLWMKFKKIKRTVIETFSILEVYQEAALVHVICPKGSSIIRSKGGLILLADRNCAVQVDGIVWQSSSQESTGTGFTSIVLINVAIQEASLATIAGQQSPLTYTSIAMTILLYLAVVAVIGTMYWRRRKRNAHLVDNLQTHWENCENEFINEQAASCPTKRLVTQVSL